MSPGAELEQRPGVRDVLRNVERPDLVVIVGPIVTPREDSDDSHLA
jgi:hypothetical protein